MAVGVREAGAGPADPRHDDGVVAADIRVARTLPPQAFTAQDWADLEARTLWRTSWLAIPDRPAADLRDDPRPMAELVRLNGARAPFLLVDRPCFLQRDRDGVLRAFPNVCTHAWHALVAGPARDRALVCPQHGRRFALDGTMLEQPGFPAGTPDFPGRDDHLRPMPVVEWGPLLFTRLADGPEGMNGNGLRDALGLVAESLGPSLRRPLRRVAHGQEERVVAGDWKQHAWNYLDSLHIPFVHSRPGGLADAVEMASYRTEVHADAVLQWAYARDPAHGFEPSLVAPRFADPAGRRVYALWWFLAPNLTLNYYPWGLSVNQYLPAGPGQTRFLWTHYAWDEALYARRDAWHLQSVDDEDVQAIGQVARGLRSGAARPGRFAPGVEAAPHWFHRWVSLAVHG